MKKYDKNATKWLEIQIKYQSFAQHEALHEGVKNNNTINFTSAVCYPRQNDKVLKQLLEKK